MEDTTIKALIAAGAAVVGATIAAIAKGYSSKQKLLELKVAYDQKLHDGYLANAREYTQAIYVPFSVELTKLGFSFQNYLCSNEKNGNLKDKPKEEFIESIKKFQSFIKGISERGASAFLTTELDEKLQSFCSFLENSALTTEPVIRMVFHYSVPFVGASYNGEYTKDLKGSFASFLRSRKISWYFFEIGFTYEAEDILAAPIGSSDFKQRFSKDIKILNLLVKEVTLGATARKSL